MSSSNLVRLGGGLASIVAGVLLLVGHLLNLGGHPQYVTVLGSSAVLTAYVILVFALVALYAAQAERSGFLGVWGLILSVIGTTLASGVILAEIAGASGVEAEAVTGARLSSVLSLLGDLSFLIGLILFGIATMQAGVFPGWAGILLIVGDVVFWAASFSGSAALIVEVVGAMILCAAFVWLGSALLSGGGAPSGQPARVTLQQVSRTLRNMGDWLENRSSLEIFLLGFAVYVLIAVIVFLTLKSFIDPKNVAVNHHYVAQDVGLAMAGVAGALGVFFTWRSLRQTRASTQRTLELTEQGQITERFTRATDQLGATNDKGEKKLEIRLGGIYALERIARNSESDYWTIMDILSAYVREQASHVIESDNDVSVPTS